MNALDLLIRAGVLPSPHDDDNWNIMMVHDDGEGDYGIDDDCEDDADCKNTWKGPGGITV